jgi:hypothetical protein
MAKTTTAVVKLALARVLRERKDEASARYHKAWGLNRTAGLFNEATAEKSTKYANNLIDAALALCGDPDYQFPRYRNWSAEAWAFLGQFVPEDDWNAARKDLEWERRREEHARVVWARQGTEWGRLGGGDAE